MYMNIADTDRKIDRPPFVAEHRLQLVARTTGRNDLHQMSIHTLQLPDMGKDLHSQQPQSLAVLLIDRSVVVENQDTGIYAFQYQLVIFFLLGSLVLYLIENLCHLIQGLTHQTVVTVGFSLDKMYGSIIVF